MLAVYNQRYGCIQPIYVFQYNHFAIFECPKSRIYDYQVDLMDSFFKSHSWYEYCLHYSDNNK